MASSIRHKYSSVAGAVPAAGNLVPRELAINTADGRLFTETDGGAVVEFARTTDILPGGSNQQVPYIPAASGETCVSGGLYIVNGAVLSAGVNGIYLPASPSVGATIWFVDFTGYWSQYPWKLLRNGKPIMTKAEDMTVSTSDAHFHAVYTDAAMGWRIVKG